MSRKVKYVFILIALFYTWAFFFFKWSSHDGDGWKYVISSDGKGYYAYLPKLFIDKNLTYIEHDCLFTIPTEKGFINRYYCGTAVLETPFFLMGHFSAKIFNYKVDGYSEPYALFIGLSAIFYFLAGLYFLYKLLKEKLHLPDNYLIWVLLLVCFGTNLLYYTIIKGSFSHVYSFFLITTFFYAVYKLSIGVSRKWVAIASVLLGLVIVTRPVNVMIVLLIPAFFENFTAFFRFIKSLFMPKPLLIIVVSLALPVFIQALFWFLQTGEWNQWSYKQEGFYFTNPQIVEVLFGFRRGLFVYTPLLFIALFGFFFLFKQSKYKAIWGVLFFVTFTYVTASWWNWTYGDSYSLRPFVDITVIFALLLALLISNIGVVMRKLVLSFALLFSILQTVYAYQYYAGITDITNMTRDKFFYLFLKTSDKHMNYYGGIDDIPPFAPNGFDTIHKYVETYDEFPAGHRDTRGELWLGGTEFTYPQEKHYVRHLWIEVTYRYKITHPHDMGEVLYAFHSFPPDSDSTKAYFTFRAKEYPTEKTDTWFTAHHKIWFPNSVDGNDRIKLYFWNRGEEHFLLDDYTITVMVPK
ncbi:MAG: hypothetical protein ACK4K0_04195 [Flavobacteriales bacterium]